MCLTTRADRGLVQRCQRSSWTLWTISVTHHLQECKQKSGPCCPHGTHHMASTRDATTFPDALDGPRHEM